jgi:FMN phosphatase YigB (HAD superfamily)
MMSFKSLLLDIDGVLVRDKSFQNKIIKKCIKYVQSKLPESNNPAIVANILYKKYGHTAIGLNKTFGIDTSDFNNFIYTNDILDNLQTITKSDIFQRDALYIRDLIDLGWEVNLFSNAPDSYQWMVAAAIHDVIGCHPLGTNGENRQLKPDPLAYKYFSKQKTHVFIDDSIINLDTASKLPNWHPVHYSSDEKSVYPQVSSILELSKYIHHIDNKINV